jgi:hypothetical protein
MYVVNFELSGALRGFCDTHNAVVATMLRALIRLKRGRGEKISEMGGKVEPARAEYALVCPGSAVGRERRSP